MTNISVNHENDVKSVSLDLDDLNTSNSNEVTFKMDTSDNDTNHDNGKGKSRGTKRPKTDDGADMANFPQKTSLRSAPTKVNYDESLDESGVE